MSLTIPDEVMTASGLTADELRTELALALFARDRLTLAQAARLAGVLFLDFQRLLKARDIPIHYGVEEFEADLETLKKVANLTSPKHLG